MKAEEKARELVERFESVQVTFQSSSHSPIEKYDLTREEAKQCALIAVDEILKNIEATKLYHKESKALPLNEQYWNEVKQEIEKL